jgi:hypothetical protein
LVAGGGHNTLNAGTEGADFVPFFHNYGVNTVMLRNRLRRDGYSPQTDAVYDALQAVGMVRAYAREWEIDPNKIGIIGFSAGAELSSATAVLFDDFDEKNTDAPDPVAGFTARPIRYRDVVLYLGMFIEERSSSAAFPVCGDCRRARVADTGGAVASVAAASETRSVRSHLVSAACMESKSLRSSKSASIGMSGDGISSLILWSILQDLVAHRRAVSLSHPQLHQSRRSVGFPLLARESGSNFAFG